MTEASPARRGEQGRAPWSWADLISCVRIPLAGAFLLIPSTSWRMAIVAAAAATDLVDGPMARRLGGSPLGPVIDPIADKVFMASAVGVVAFSGRLEIWEIVGVLLRDIVATLAFLGTLISHQPRAIPARSSGKAVTVAQILTLIAFLLDSPYLRPVAWATTLIAVIAIWEIVGVLLRDIVATLAFLGTLISHEPRAIPARSSGKAVTVAQILTLIAFLLDSPYLRPVAWATTLIAVIAIWDYYRVAPRAQKRLGA